MKEYQLVKGYRQDPLLRKSFNRLTKTTFGLDFSPWYKQGYWYEDYIPYSYLDEGQVIANVSVYLMKLVVKGQDVEAAQIGTVMTAKSHRNQGLAKKLMTQVMTELETKYELIYLFANETVLDFYPQFGFSRKDELNYTLKVEVVENKRSRPQIEKISLQTHRSLLQRLASERVAHSPMLSAVENSSLLLFYFSVPFSDFIYYFEALDVILVMEEEEGVLHLYDVIATFPVDMKQLLTLLSYQGIREIIPYFGVEGVPSKIVSSEDDVLFVKGNRKIIKQLTLFPITTHC